MEARTPAPRKAKPVNLRSLTLFGLLGANLFVLALAAFSLHHSRTQYEARAQMITRDMAQTIDLSLGRSIDKLDLALQAVADELEHQLQQQGRLEARSVEGMLERYQQRLPEVEALRIADAEGLVIFGKGLNPQERPSWADREYFSYLRDHPEGGLQVSKPRQGKVAKKYIVGFSRRYNYPDGRFAGVISAPIALDYFQQLLAHFNLGPRGAIILRDGDLGLIARHPAVSSGPLSHIGNRDVSLELARLGASGVSSATYHTPQAADQLERIATFRRISKAPMIIVASMASEDYLAGWYDEVSRSIAWIIGFAVLSTLAAGFALVLLKRITREGFRNQLFLHHASDGICILDARGSVVQASDSFRSLLGLGQEDIIGMHLADWEARHSRTEVINDLLPKLLAQPATQTFESRYRARQGELIEVEISCSSFQMDGQAHLFLSCRDIRERKQQQAALQAQENRLRESEERYRLLLKNSPVGILHYDRDLIVSYSNDRFEQIMGVPPGHMRGLDCKTLHDTAVLPAMRQALHGEAGHYEGPYVTSYGGRALFISMDCAPLRSPGGAILGGIVILEDITARTQSENSLRRQRQSLIHLNEIAASLHLPITEQLRQALAIGARHLDLEFGIVSHISGDQYQVVTQVSPPDTLQDGQCFPFAQTYCAITLAANEVVAIAEMGKSPHLGHPCYQAFKLETYIGAPIQVGGAVYGTVNFSSPKPYHRAFDEGDLEFIRLLARWVGSALERDQAEKRVQASEAHLRAIFENEPECVKVLGRDGTLLQMNRAGLEMIEVDDVAEANDWGLFNFIVPESRQAFKKLNDAVFAGQGGTLEYQIEGKRGTRRWLETHATPLRDEQGQVVSQLAVTRDITLFKEHQGQLEYMAHHDALTRLPNRALLSDRMHQALAQARRTGTRIMVGYLDLDGFKAINDGFGHQAGDELLIEVAERLNQTVRQGDTVARLGGDEFVLLLVGIQSEEEWQTAANRVLQALAVPVRIQGHTHCISGSLGITLFPDDDQDPDTLLRHADQAMYQAKQAGKNRYQRFS